MSGYSWAPLAWIFPLVVSWPYLQRAPCSDGTRGGISLIFVGVGAWDDLRVEGPGSLSGGSRDTSCGGVHPIKVVPNDNRDSDNALVFRVPVGRSRIGDAWAARSAGDSQKDYLRVRFDDPSLPEPISAALF